MYGVRIRSAWLSHYLCGSYMKELAVSEAREHLAEAIEETHRSGEPIYVTRRGRRVAVIVDPDTYERVVDACDPSIRSLRKCWVECWVGGQQVRLVKEDTALNLDSCGGPPGARTRHLGIKSPLLYPMS